MHGSSLFIHCNSVKDSVLSKQVRSDSFNKNMGNDLSCLKCEGDRKETDPPLGKYCILLNDCIRNNLAFTGKTDGQIAH